jgi:hypothetical protein
MAGCQKSKATKILIGEMKMTKYICVPFENLKEGQEVLSFGVHMIHWNFNEWGDPAYAFIPDETTEEEEGK